MTQRKLNFLFSVYSVPLWLFLSRLCEEFEPPSARLFKLGKNTVQQLAIYNSQKGDLLSVDSVQHSKIAASKTKKRKVKSFQLLDLISLRKWIR